MGAVKVTLVAGPLPMEFDRFGDARSSAEVDGTSVESAVIGQPPDCLIASIQRLANGTFVVHVTNGRGDDSRAEIFADGRCRHYVLGSRPLNETGSALVAWQLARALHGEQLPDSSFPEPVDPPGDRRIVVKDQVRIVQVTRPDVGLWPGWTTPGAGGAIELVSVPALADGLAGAVGRKSKKYTAADRAGLVLAIDAIRFAGHAAPQVVQDFLTRHAHAAKAAGFAEIWVVGPMPEMVHRLA
jgi:hypothetical protein